MTEDDGWSTPSLHRARAFEPRTFTEADPMSAVLVADWAVEADRLAAEAPEWSETTYVGPRRKRPKPGRTPATTPDSAPDDAGLTSALPAAPAREQVEDEQSVADRLVEQPARPRDRGLLANSRTMAIASLASRVTGFLRSALLVAALGTGPVADAYNLGNTLPNMVYELLLGGVLSSVLIPLLVQAQETDRDDGVAYTQRLLSLATAALAVLTLLAVAAAPLLAGGFVHAGSQRSLTTLWATLLLPEIFFYGIGAMLMAVLNIRHSFGPGAWAPMLNNVIVIATVLVFWTLPGPKAFTPATITTPQVLVIGIGTTLGIAAQAVVLIPSLRRTGFRWKWRFRARPEEAGRMKEVGTLAGWVLAYVVASQVGVIVIAVIGGHSKAYTVFTNADLLVQMPYGILVVSLLTALMPRLSRAAAREDRDAVVQDINLGTRLSALALIPVTFGLIVLGQALTITIFNHGRTTLDEARLYGTALAASAFGLFPFAMVMLQLRVFYAVRDGRTPTIINVFMVGAKVAIVLVCANLFHDPARVAVALTVGTSASYVVGAVVGHVALTRRLGHLGMRGAVGTVVRVTAASVVGAAAAFGVALAVQHLLGHARLGAAVTLVAGSVVGLAVLAVVLWQLGSREVRHLLMLARSG